MVQHVLPQPVLIDQAMDLKSVVLLGNTSENEHSWKHNISAAQDAGWEVYIVDPNNYGKSFEGHMIHSTVLEIEGETPLIQFMDTTEKARWFDLCSNRMEEFGDIQMVWMHKGNVVTHMDRADANAFGWDIIENACLAQKLSE